MTENIEQVDGNNLDSKKSEWFYAAKGERMGVSEAEIIELIKKQIITHGTLVWKKGLVDWAKVENTELRTYVDDISPPPLTGEGVSNSIVWVMAFTPFIGEIIEYFIVNLIYEDPWRVAVSSQNNEFWFITIILNTLLAAWDEKRIKKAGIDTSKFSIWWGILVPVYLFKRSKALKQNLSYFIVWIVCFLLVCLS